MKLTPLCLDPTLYSPVVPYLDSLYFKQEQNGIYSESPSSSCILHIGGLAGEIWCCLTHLNKSASTFVREDIVYLVESSLQMRMHAYWYFANLEHPDICWNFNRKYFFIGSKICNINYIVTRLLFFLKTKLFTYFDSRFLVP